MNVRRLLRQPLLTVAFHEREVRWTIGSPGAIDASGRVPLPPGMVNDGLVVDSVAAGTVLRESPGFAGNGRMQVAIALPAQRSVFRQLEIPSLPGRQFDEMVEREIRRELPMVVENAYVSWQRLSERDGKVEVFIVGVARDQSFHGDGGGFKRVVAPVRKARRRPPDQTVLLFGRGAQFGRQFVSQRGFAIAHGEFQ